MKFLLTRKIHKIIHSYYRGVLKQADRDKMKDGILEKYNFPILRFRTNESHEKEKLIDKLNELQQRK